MEKNELLQKYSVRKLKGALANEYIVLEKGHYIATVEVDLMTEEPLKIIDFHVAAGGRTLSTEDCSYCESAVVLEAVARYVFEPVIDRYIAKPVYYN